MSKEVKETIRRFKITSDLVINTKDNLEISDELLMLSVKYLIESNFEKTNPDVLLSAEVTDISEESL